MSVRQIYLMIKVSLGILFLVLGAGAIGMVPASAKDNVPLQPSRHIEFTTNEGTYISLDVAPDGKFLVFDMLGDIYALPIEGGEAVQITSGPAYDWRPKISPDGSRIAFLSDRSGSLNVWVSNIDGTNPKQITDEPVNSKVIFETPAWLPDSNSVAVSSSKARVEPLNLRMFSVDGKKVRVIESSQSSEVFGMGPVFGPDQNIMYFAAPTGSFYDVRIKNEAIFPNWQISKINLKTGEVYPLTSRNEGGYSPVVSPDGRWLVYATREGANTGYRIRDLTEGKDGWFLFPVDRDQQEGQLTDGLMQGAAFTPDSKSFVLSMGGKIWRAEVPSGKLYQIPFEVKVQRELGPLLKFSYSLDNGPVMARHMRSVRLSPDGRKVALTALQKIWVADLDTGKARIINNTDLGAEQYPAWAPDGKSIVFAAWDPSLGGGLYRVPLDGIAPPVKITIPEGIYSSPVYSPDGSRIIVVRGFDNEGIAVRGDAPEAPAIYWLPVDGGQLTHIVDIQQTMAVRPHFAADPMRVYYFQENEGLMSVKLNGSDLRKHIHVTGMENPTGTLSSASTYLDASDILLSPDGQSALALVGAQIYLINLPGSDILSLSHHNISVADNAATTARKISAAGGLYMDWLSDSTEGIYSLGSTIFQFHMPKSTSGKIKTTQKKLTMSVPRDTPQTSFAMTGARIITMAGDTVFEKGTIVVRKDRIAEVGSDDQVKIPSGVKVINAEGKTIVPGFIDSHCHIEHAHPFFHPATPEVRQEWQYRFYLAFGITTCFDPYASPQQITRSDMVDAGIIQGPRIITTGLPLEWYETINNEEDARNLVQRQGRYFDLNHIKQYVVGSRRQRQLLAKAAKEENVSLIVETIDVPYNLSNVLDGYTMLAHTFPTSSVYKDVIELLRLSGTSVAFQFGTLRAEGGPSAMYYYLNKENPFEDEKVRRFVPAGRLNERLLRRLAINDSEQVFPEYAALANRFMTAGIPIGIGDHGEWMGIGYHWELQSLKSGNMSNANILRVATEMNAKIIGYQPDLGSIEQGKKADFVILNSNPLEDIRSSRDIAMVVKNGEVFDGDTLDVIYPEKPKSEKPWWKKYELPFAEARRLP